ncbi:hypothetical protein SacN8_10080 [Sulfolobus acidocaldarius N8]|uniref:Uncharacterized protein n=2 Tax=Sulfolobus acidocaldarius TaxID=2285 RepID=M1IFR2_9CREN|nr:hypothetical protein SacN8_10080 [Sulfolobus acidocaldarius N8]AGE74238.1 hypothetical protein SacRon12I_10100 [Sulfolobus acidocaldarius Ron12/I]
MTKSLRVNTILLEDLNNVINRVEKLPTGFSDKSY